MHLVLERNEEIEMYADVEVDGGNRTHSPLSTPVSARCVFNNNPSHSALKEICLPDDYILIKCIQGSYY